ncbi:MAG: alpha/beta hydrolase, partial [Acidimicrobiales bacterium]|nr:alpha/beta hydrolase [Acidimicrobiales bacterium]
MPSPAAPGTDPAALSASELPPVEWVVTADGTRVAAYDEGGSGPDLLLVHATGFCAAVLRPLARHLAPHYHCWSIDLRAHGRSQPPADGDFRWTGFADDVASTIDHLGLRRPRAFGHSCGGTAAVLAEEGRPGTFAALYGFEPVILPLGPSDRAVEDNPLTAGARRRRPSFPSREDALANFAAKGPFGQLDPAVLRLYVEEGLEIVPATDGGDGRAVRLRCRREDEAEIYAWGASHGAFA